MNIHRSTFQSATYLSLPYPLYDVIYHDACYFGYLKGDTPNINGFLNHLIPALSDFHDNLHNRFLDFLDGDETRTQSVEQSILHVYLDPFGANYDTLKKVPFRVTEKSMEDFLRIHDIKLEYYKTDFSGYIRTLLADYTSRTVNQRECLFSYRMLPTLKTAIEQGLSCHFYCADQTFVFVPVCLEISPVSRRNLICGISAVTNEDVVLALSSVLSIAPGTSHHDFTDEDCSLLFDTVEKFFEKEKTV